MKVNDRIRRDEIISDLVQLRMQMDCQSKILSSACDMALTEFSRPHNISDVISTIRDSLVYTIADLDIVETRIRLNFNEKWNIIPDDGIQKLDDFDPFLDSDD